MTKADEANIPSRVAELMRTLDQVKRYKELARSLVDFALIMLGAVISILSVYIGMNFYQALAGPLPTSMINYGVGGIVLSDVQGFSAFVIFAAGLFIGIYWIDRRMKDVKVGEWKSKQNDGVLGSVKILSELDWPTVFQDIRYSKLGFVLYSILKVIGYWILASILVFFVTEFSFYYLHAQMSNYYVATISMMLVLVLSRKDLQRRYNQSWALDSLLWELRWFDSEFRGKAEFGKSSG